MTIYRVTFLSESGSSLAGQLVFYDSQGIALGATGVHTGGSDILDTDIPAGTVLYDAVVPGYKPLSTQTIFETTTFTLAKETPVAQYVVLGGLAVGAVVLLSRFIKF